MKKYSITSQFEIMAENDKEAVRIAEDWAKLEDIKNDNRMNIYSIYQQQKLGRPRFVHGTQEFNAK